MIRQGSFNTSIKSLSRTFDCLALEPAMLGKRELLETRRNSQFITLHTECINSSDSQEIKSLARQLGIRNIFRGPTVTDLLLDLSEEEAKSKNAFVVAIRAINAIHIVLLIKAE